MNLSKQNRDKELFTGEQCSEVNTWNKNKLFIIYLFNAGVLI